jgi:hypothetical protein
MEVLMSWTNKNTRQLLTWAYLYTEKEIETSFGESESVKLKTLPYWQHAGGGLDRVTARPLAIGLHDLVSSEEGARYEDTDTTYSNAISKLIDTLVDSSASVKSLADTVDDLFHLSEEG